MKMSLRTWVEIDTKAIKQNFKSLSSFVSKNTKVMAIVKSNAYGHGLIPFAKELEKNGAEYFGVYEFSEALELRKAGIKSKILVLGWTGIENLEMCVKKNIEVTVSNFEILKVVSGMKIKFHLKVDTGLGRQGFLSEEMQKVLKELQKVKNAELVGLYTHFAIAEDPKHISYTKMQIEKVLRWQKALHENGYSFIAHAGASSGLLFGEELHLDMVRVGIAMYGLWPSNEIKKHVGSEILKPVLSWKTRISEIKKVPKGSAISYDLTEKVKRDSVLAILPVGYWDGFARSLSSRGEVVINGSRAKIIGRICMNMCIVDITDIKNLKAGSEVILIGKGMSAEEMAEKAGTINYEIVTRINPEIIRVLTK